MEVISMLIVFLVLFWPNGPFLTAAKMGRDMLFACFNEKTLGEHSKAVHLNGTEIVKPSEESLDESKQRQPWERMVAIVGIKDRDTVLKDRNR
jgi:hypothetical protein